MAEESLDTPVPTFYPYKFQSSQSPTLPLTNILQWVFLLPHCLLTLLPLLSHSEAFPPGDQTTTLSTTREQENSRNRVKLIRIPYTLP